MFFSAGVHEACVGLEIPPHESEVAVHDSGTGVDMADDALAAGD